MMRPREIRRMRREARPVIEAIKHPLIVVTGGREPEPEPSAAQLAAAERLREEHDLLHLGIPSDAALWRAMARAK